MCKLTCEHGELKNLYKWVMNTIVLQFVIPKRMHSRAGLPGKTLIDITVKVNYSCTFSDMPFNCQDGGEEVEGRWDGAVR